jgi:flagellar protein FliL
MPPPPKSEAAGAAKGAAKPDAAAEAPAAAPAPAAPAPSGGIKAWIPVIAALLLAPAATWATVEFVLVPRVQKKLAAAVATPADGSAEHAPAPAPAPAESHGSHGKGKDGKDAKDAAPGYEYQNVVVNLAGTMGTRYLKTSFLVTGTDPNIKGVFEASKPKLYDITLNVLSSLTLADLEEPGAKNVIREKLVTAYNQALGRKVADQVYFSDFVIQ